MSDTPEYPFGADLSAMDMEAFLWLRGWLRDALEAAGADCHSSGIGLGQVDVQFRIGGYPYTVSAKPVPKGST